MSCGALQVRSLKKIRVNLYRRTPLQLVVSAGLFSWGFASVRLSRVFVFFFGFSESLLGLIWVHSAKVCCRLSRVGSDSMVMTSSRLVCTCRAQLDATRRVSLMRHGVCRWHARVCARLAVSGGGLGKKAGQAALHSENGAVVNIRKPKILQTLQR